MSARRPRVYLPPPKLLARRARVRWETLAFVARLDDCDARLCAKLGKLRKIAWRSERRVVRQLMRDAACVEAPRVHAKAA